MQIQWLSFIPEFFSPPKADIEKVPAPKEQKVEIVAQEQIKKRKRTEDDFLKFPPNVKRKVNEPSDPLPESKFARAYPPLGELDTIRKNKNGKIVSAHPKGLSFKDEEIVEVRGVSVEPEAIFKTKSGRSVLQQQGNRGCTAACVEMLKADRGFQVDWKYMRTTNLGDSSSMNQQLADIGFKALVIKKVSVEKLEEILRKNGSAILSIDSGIGGHVVVLDAIHLKKNLADIRDPYHGWAVRIKVDALQKSMGNFASTVQIEKCDPEAVKEKRKK